MLTVNGIVIVTETPKANPYKDFTYFTTEVSSPDPKTEGKKHWYTMSIYVPKDKVELAQEQIIEGALIYIRTGDLSAEKFINNITKEKSKRTLIKVSFNNLQFLTILKRKNKEEARNDTTPPKSK